MKKLNISKDFLYKEYIVYKKSANIIATEFDCSESGILSHLKIKNIKIKLLMQPKLKKLGVL